MKWRSRRLGDLATVEHGWPFKSQCFSEAPHDPVVLAIGNFDYSGGFRFDRSTVKRYSGDYPVQYRLAPGDIVLVMTCQTAGGEILGVPALLRPMPLIGSSSTTGREPHCSTANL